MARLVCWSTTQGNSLGALAEAGVGWVHQRTIAGVVAVERYSFQRRQKGSSVVAVAGLADLWLGVRLRFNSMFS